jgi:small subunit ribosomal protein S20
LPNKKSAKKRVKQNARDEARNRAAKATMKTMIKKTVDVAVSGSEPVEAVARETQSLIARLDKRGIIHKNKAARLQSRLTRKVSKVAGAKPTA